MIKYVKENKINIFILALYLSFVFVSQVIVAKISGINLFFASILILICSFLLSTFVLWIIERIRIDINDPTKRKRIRMFIIDFIVLFVVHFIINYFKSNIANKNLFEPDFLWAILQAQNNSYYEFSSPLFILIFAKIPLLITSNEYFIIIYYMLIRSLIISIVISGITDNIVINIILLLYYTIMPLSIHSELCLMKDTPCGLFTMMSIYLIYKSLYNDNYKSELKYDVLIAILLVLTYFMRPNAMLYAIPMCAMLFIIYLKNIKRSLRIVVLFLISIMLINNIFFSVMPISRTEKEKSLYEIMSIPIVSILSIAKEKPEVLNDEEMKILQNMAGESDFSNFLNTFDEKIGYESIKFHGNVYEASKDYTYIGLMKCALDLLKKEPFIVIRQWILSTCGLYSYRNLMIKSVNSWYADVYYFFENIEMPILLFLLIAIVLAKNKFKKEEPCYNFLLVLPILLYAGGTMVIITSPAIFRYYLPLQMSIPVYILNNFKNKRNL